MQIYTAKILGNILHDRYFNASENDKVVSIHLFGIEFWRIIEDQKIKVQEIISNAQIKTSYATELSKGLRIGKVGNLETLNNENNQEYAWYVGAVIDENDMTEEFVENGIWINGNIEKYSGLVNQIKPNDSIAIKAAYTIKNDLPFNSNGKYVSAIRIKAVGKVIKNLNDGVHLEVDWDKNYKTKDWYVLTYGIRSTVTKLFATDQSKQAFIDFTFNDKHQDYAYLNNLFKNSETGKIELYGELDLYNLEYIDLNFEPVQKIIYGAPGTGKSYMIDDIIKNSDYSNYDSYYFSTKIIFHSNYTYYDFIGSIKPIRSIDRLLEYVFVPGPFTLLLKKCFQNPQQKFYLIIEEFNRGNVAEIFGDIIQLLDRNHSGISSYKIINYEIANYLRNELSHYSIFDSNYIWLPSNFNLLCTMNTADQNIFSIDSALRRRFNMEFVEIDFNKMPESYFIEYDTFNGRIPLIDLFSNTSLNKQVERLNSTNTLKRNWPTFATLVNKIIDNINQDGGIEQISEDKKLGPFFITLYDLDNRRNFINKVIYYLKQDVFKYEEKYFIDSYEEIFKKYIVENQDIFELLKDRTLQ